MLDHKGQGCQVHHALGRFDLVYIVCAGLQHIRQRADGLPLLILHCAADQIADIILVFCQRHGVLAVNIEHGTALLFCIVARLRMVQRAVNIAVAHGYIGNRPGGIGVTLLYIYLLQLAKAGGIVGIGPHLYLAANALRL